jgi:predicted transcriptional regulator
MDLKNRKGSGDRPGFTKTCRIVLMEAESALTAREVCERVKQRIENVDLRHKDPLASVTTVLNRLADYGEARIVVAENGRRAWQWIAETSSNEQTREAQKTTERTESSPQKSSVTD